MPKGHAGRSWLDCESHVVRTLAPTCVLCEQKIPIGARYYARYTASKTQRQVLACEPCAQAAGTSEVSKEQPHIPRHFFSVEAIWKAIWEEELPYCTLLKKRERHAKF